MRKGFTLVELAIVITIIGFLIGGVLKGQELLENARITGAGAEIVAFRTATITFTDIYKALPGDITNPANFLQNCTAAPCNISGNGDGYVGPHEAETTGRDQENDNFFHHIGQAGLLSNVPTTTLRWSASDPYPIISATSKLGGYAQIRENNFSATAYAAASYGRGWFFCIPEAGCMITPEKRVMQYDLKFDDGKPRSGDVRAGNCLQTTQVAYDPNSAAMCQLGVKSLF